MGIAVLAFPNVQMLDLVGPVEVFHEAARQAGAPSTHQFEIVSTAPASFVEDARIDAARRLLEETKHPLKRVASLTGFADPNGLRRAFLRRLGVSPVEYRRRFLIAA